MLTLLDFATTDVQFGVDFMDTEHGAEYLQA